MSEYEFGNWYCVPANEADAREIVERAVASGARRYETLIRYGFDNIDAWGVIDGRTITSYVTRGGLFENATEYTIAELREKFPLPGERVENEAWNGEGLPPVGVECEMKSGEGWIKAMLIGFDGDSPIFKLHEIVNERSTQIKYMPCYLCTFRPLRTEREKWVDAAARIPKPCGFAIVPIMEQIYDAMQSGALKMPEVK